VAASGPVTALLVVIPHLAARSVGRSDVIRLAAMAAVAGLHRGVPADRVRLRRRCGRRPLAVVDERRVFVSASASAGAVLTAAGDSPVGVDVERRRLLREAAAITGMVDGLWPDRQRVDLVQAWTRYESVVKALGVGLTVAPGRIGMRPDRGATMDDIALPLTIVDLAVGTTDPDLRASITTRSGAPPRLEVRSLTDLLVDFRIENVADDSGFPHRPTFNSLIRMDNDMNAVLDKELLRKTVADTLDVPVDEVTDTADFREDLEVDSLMALELMVVLERSYGVKLDQARLPGMTSLDKVYDLLDEHLRDRA
jgi:acyl carrier protein